MLTGVFLVVEFYTFSFYDFLTRLKTSNSKFDTLVLYRFLVHLSHLLKNVIIIKLELERSNYPISILVACWKKITRLKVQFYS